LLCVFISNILFVPGWSISWAAPAKKIIKLSKSVRLHLKVTCDSYANT
jgi:hypothetical protein